MGAAVLTIGDIVGTSSLDVAFVAGDAGESREVLWAHSCEMVDPSEWLGPHELLMTVGLCIPESPLEQVSFIARLDDAGLAGMIVGDHDIAPALSESMREEADRRGFPILVTGRGTPYAVIARHVAAANTAGQTLHVLKLSKLYHLAASADSNEELVRIIAAFLTLTIDVVDTRTGGVILSSRAPDESIGHLRRTTRKYEIRGHHNAQLWIDEIESQPLDSFLLVHLLKIIEVAVDRMLDTADLRAQLSATHLTAVLSGVRDHDVTSFLSPHVVADGFHVIAFTADDGPRVALTAATASLPSLIGARGADYLALVPSSAMLEFRRRIDPLVRDAGVSSRFADFADVRAAASEARNVLPQGGSDTGWIDYSGVTVSVLTRSKREAASVVSGVLGTLADNDERARTLRTTLFTFLKHDRSWQPTAEALSIHRQTLGYRLRRIEEEANLDMSRSADLAAAWIAYQAWQLLHDDWGE